MKLINILLYLIGIFSTLYIVGISGIPVSTLLSAVCLLAIIIVYGKMVVVQNKYFFAFLCLAATTSVFMLFIDRTYLMTQIITLAVMVCIYLCISNINILPKSSLMYFISGLKLSCIIHIIWCILQLVLYNVCDIDINKLIFADTLHMVENASSYKNGRLSITGFCWHPSNLIPVLIIANLMFNKWYIWAVSFFIVIYAHSGTALLGLLFVFILMIPLNFNKIVLKIAKKPVYIFSIIAFVTAGIVIVMKSDLHITLYDKYIELYNRVFGEQDMSTTVHMRYYTMLPFIWGNASIIEILFGYGLGCSGVLFSKYCNQYTELGAWVVESDPMNFMYSVGLLGFIAFYLWLIHIIYISRRKDKRYLVLFLSLIFCGITYNVQYQWLIMVELFIGICLRKNIDFFNSEIPLLYRKKVFKRNKQRLLLGGLIDGKK